MSVSNKRFYIYEDVLPYDEDICHEFKGHRNIVHAEIPPKSVQYRSRSAISKTINAFLNTGIGGTIYCGVDDDGKLLGLYLSPYQMDHMKLSIKDALSSYKPAVPDHRKSFIHAVHYSENKWRLEFIPIFTNPPKQEELDELKRIREKQKSGREHVIRTYKYCWCDKDARAALSNGMMYNEYIAEIIIEPWRRDNPADSAMVGTETKIPPIHESDDGIVYMRSNASVKSLTLPEIVELTKTQVQEYYTQ